MVQVWEREGGLLGAVGVAFAEIADCQTDLVVSFIILIMANDPVATPHPIAIPPIAATWSHHHRGQYCALAIFIVFSSLSLPTPKQQLQPSHPMALRLLIRSTQQDDIEGASNIKLPCPGS